MKKYRGEAHVNKNSPHRRAPSNHVKCEYFMSGQMSPAENYARSSTRPVVTHCGRECLKRAEVAQAIVANEGHVRYTSGEPQPGTAHLRPGPYLWSDQVTYYARGETGPFSSEGVFDHRFCVSDFPREVDGLLVLSEDLATLSVTHFSTDGEVAVSFVGQRRD